MGFLKTLLGLGKNSSQNHEEEAQVLCQQVMQEHVDYSSEKLRRHRNLGLVYLRVTGLVQLEKIYGYSACHQVLMVLKNSIDQAKPFPGGGDKLQMLPLGNEEFIVYYALPQGTSSEVLDNLDQLAEDLRVQMLELANKTLGRILKKPIELQVGSALLNPDANVTMNELVKGAMREAEAIARGEYDSKWKRRISELRKDIELGNFTIAYQPVISIQQNKVMGHEALCRVPKGSYFDSPSVLFSLAEKGGLLYELESTIYNKVFEQYNKTNKDLLFININPSLVYAPEYLPDHLKKVVERHGVPPQKVVVEISEYGAVRDIISFRRLLQQQREAGFLVAVDDAGASFSNLHAYAELRPDFIKVDMSAVRDISRSAAKQVLVETFVAFTRRIGARLVAEGVETEAELHRLIHLGVDMAQGNYIGSPIAEKTGISTEAAVVITKIEKTKTVNTNKSSCDTKCVANLISKNTAHGDMQIIAANAYEHAPEGLIIIDEHGTIKTANNAFLVVTGYSKGEVVGIKLESLLKPGAELLGFAQQATNYSCCSDNQERETWYRHKDGNFYPACIKASTIRDCSWGTGHYVCLFSDITARKRYEEKIKHQAFHDSLTGLPNRMLFKDRLNQALAHAQRERQYLAVMYLDLDGFKKINDTLGHAAGDALLLSVSNRLLGSLRKCDTVARLGGDEFAILLTEINNKEDAINVARKILVALRQPCIINGHEVAVTTSIGIAIYPESGGQEEILVKNADIAMYQAKHQGRNSYRVFSPTMADEKSALCKQTGA